MALRTASVPARWIAALLLVAVATARADEVSILPIRYEPWADEFRRASLAMARQDYGRARSLFAAIEEKYPSEVDVVDRAQAGYASTFLRERRFARAIAYLEERIGDAPTTSRRTRDLYIAMEKRIRRARDRAEAAVAEAEEAYEDISWFNIFRIFTKLSRRRDLKNAEEDLDELKELHGLFDEELLEPLPEILPMASGTSTGSAAGSTAATTGSAGAAASASKPETATTSATVTVVPTPTPSATPVASEAPVNDPDPPANDSQGASAPSTGTASDPRAEAYRVLEAEIDALVALIPTDRLDQANAILTGLAAPRPADATAPTTQAAAAQEPATAAADPTPVATGAAAGATTTSTEASAATTPPADSSPPAETATGTVELLGGNPSAPAESTVSTTAPVVAPPANPGDARRAYNDAYAELREALRSNDPARVAAAREAYVAALQALSASQAALMGHGSVGTGAPAAPGTSGEASPPTTGTPRGSAERSVNPGTGTFTPDRTGTLRGLGDGALRGTRRSFQ